MHRAQYFRKNKAKAMNWLKEIAKREPNMFPRWATGYAP